MVPTWQTPAVPSPHTPCTPAEPWGWWAVHALQGQRVPRPLLWLPGLSWAEDKSLIQPKALTFLGEAGMGLAVPC